MAATRISALILLSLAAFSFGQKDLICDDELNSIHLTQAVDAAITSLAGKPSWLYNLKSENGYAKALDIFSCTPDDSRWTYPKAEDATGILKRVLERGELIVAGVQWAQPGAADYKTNPENPTGFWPEYLTAIVDELSKAYGKNIKLTRKYYENSVLVVDAVQEGKDVDMSEPYYYLSGFAANDPRIEAMGFSCVTAGTASAFYVNKGSGITNMEGLTSAISNGEGNMIGFIGQGNYDSVSSALPESVTPVIIEDANEIIDGVKSGKLIAGYLSEGSEMGAEFEVFDSGIISPRTVLFRKELPQCPEGITPETFTAESGIDSSSSIELVVIIVLAVVALLLAILLSIVVVKERQGSPIFSRL